MMLSVILNYKCVAIAIVSNTCCRCFSIGKHKSFFKSLSRSIGCRSYEEKWASMLKRNNKSEIQQQFRSCMESGSLDSLCEAEVLLRTGLVDINGVDRNAVINKKKDSEPLLCLAAGATHDVDSKMYLTGLSEMQKKDNELVGKPASVLQLEFLLFHGAFVNILGIKF